jgi:AcrR family transcriptional regulator
MDQPAQPRKIYKEHRDRQREGVIKAAEKLFIERGIEPVSIADIAAQAGVTRATVYQYFANKQEMAWGILSGYFEQLSDASPIEQWSARPSGYDQVEAFTHSLFEFFWDDLDRARFMAQFDHIYASEWSPERMAYLLQDILGERQRFLVAALQKGMSDGSLRSDLDPALTAVAITNLIIGLERRLSLMPQHVEAEYGQPAQAIYRAGLQIILQGIRG